MRFFVDVDVATVVAALDKSLRKHVPKDRAVAHVEQINQIFRVYLEKPAKQKKQKKK